MTAQLAPTPIQKFFDNNGNPLFNGKLYSYVAGTSTPQATYTDSTMGTQNTNPVILNARGEANVWLDTTLSYKLVLQEANGTQIWVVDNIPGNGVFGTIQNIAALRNVTGVGVSNYQAIIVDGYTTAGDGGGGTFWWNSTSTVADNGGTIIAPTGVSTGRWYRIFSGAINVRWFGAVGDGVTDDTAAVQAAFTYCNAITLAPCVYVPAGNYLCSANITCSPQVGISGDGWHNSEIRFTGASVTLGINVQGNNSTYPFGSTFKDIYVQGVSGAITGITLYGLNHPRLERVWVAGFSSIGIYLNYCLVSMMEHCLITGCGSATNGQVEVDNSTIFMWLQSRISGSSSGTLSGLRVDRTETVNIIGGNIESTGIQIQIASKSEASIPTGNVHIEGLDLENPGDHYMEFGYGWTGGGPGTAVIQCDLINISGSTGGASSITYGVKCKNTDSFYSRGCSFSLDGTPVSEYWFEGTSNIRASTDIQHGSIPYPYVFVNGVVEPSARPDQPWTMVGTHSSLAFFTLANNSATPSISGYSACYTNSTVATSITNITGAPNLPFKLAIIAADSNTTLVHQNGGAGQLTLRGGVNKLLVNTEVYNFVYNPNSGKWVETTSDNQIGTALNLGTLVSGTIYQNSHGLPLTIYMPITYNPAAGAASTCAVDLGPSSTPSTIFTNSFPSGITALDGAVNTITLRVPPSWYYSFTVSNATINAAQAVIGA